LESKVFRRGGAGLEPWVQEKGGWAGALGPRERGLGWSPGSKVGGLGSGLLGLREEVGDSYLEPDGGGAGAWSPGSVECWESGPLGIREKSWLGPGCLRQSEEEGWLGPGALGLREEGWGLKPRI
jgi:hypothetical protein